MSGPSMAESLPEYGFCPFMSATYPVEQAPAGIRAPSGAALGTIVAQAPCMGPKCQLWNHQVGACSFRALNSLVTMIEKMNEH